MAHFDQDERSSRIPDFTLRQLAYLIEAADVGTIAEASRRLHVSSSAMSDAITELERAFGMRLCVRRRSQGFTLTAEGRRVVGRARSILRDARSLAGDDRGDLLVGRIAVGCPPTLSGAILPPLLAGFSAQHPALELEVHEAEQPALRAALDAGDIDVAFVYGRPADADDAQALTVLPMVPHVILPVGHPLAGRSSVALTELALDDLILLDASPADDRTLALLSMAGVRARVKYRSSSIDAVRTMVARGLGYSVMAQRPLSTRSAEGREFTRVEIDPVPATMAITMTWVDHAVHSRHLRALIEFARTADWG